MEWNCPSHIKIKKNYHLELNTGMPSFHKPSKFMRRTLKKKAIIFPQKMFYKFFNLLTQCDLSPYLSPYFSDLDFLPISFLAWCLILHNDLVLCHPPLSPLNDSQLFPPPHSMSGNPLGGNLAPYEKYWESLTGRDLPYQQVSKPKTNADM